MDRDGVFRRPSGTWVAQIELGLRPAQRCRSCGKGARFWVDREPLEACPNCGGPLVSTLERRREWQGGFATKREAVAWRDEHATNVRQGRHVLRRDLSVADFLEGEWLPAIRSSVRASTFESYQLHVRHYILPEIGHLRLQELSPAQLNALYAKLQASGSRTGAPLSARTVRLTHVTIRKALQDALRWGYVVRNVATLANPPQARRPEMRTWSAEELRRFLDSIGGDRLQAAYWLAASTGMRRGEVLGLRWSDVDLPAARLQVRQTLVSVGYSPTTSEPKTAKGRRQVPLDARTVAVLKEHRRRQLEERLAIGLRASSDLVFTELDGSPIHPDRFTKHFYALVRAAGLPAIRLHDLRHSWATLALQAGVHPKVVQEQLGHSTIAVTMDTYSHVVPAMQREAVDRVTGAIFGS